MPPANWATGASSHVLAETRAVGRTYGSRGALMLRERRPARQKSFRAEDPLEVVIHARLCRARCQGWRWPCGGRRTSAVAQADLATRLCRGCSRSVRLGSSDRGPLGPPACWRRTWVSAGYAGAKLRPCLDICCSDVIRTHERRQSLGRLNGRAAAVESVEYGLSENICSSGDVTRP
jgi:hypothetical protein